MKIRRSLALFLALGITVSLAACSPSALRITWSGEL